MNKFEQHVEEIRRTHLKKTFFPLRQDIKKAWAKKKIINWSERYGYDYGEVEEKNFNR